MQKRMTRKKRRRQRNVRLGLLILVLTLAAAGGARLLGVRWPGGYFERTGDQVDASRPEMDVELLTVNPYSRPGTKTDRIKGIVVHYTANPGATAMANRNYFEGLKDSHVTRSSSNFIVGLEGEIIQCVPTWEVAWLCLKFDLGPEDVIRHYDVTGKDCPRYFVQHEDAWEAFRADVGKALEKSREEP